MRLRCTLRRDCHGARIHVPRIRPTKIVCEDVPAPPGSAVGSDERGSAWEAARCSGPGRVGLEEVGAGQVGAASTSSSGAKKTWWNHFTPYLLAGLPVAGRSRVEDLVRAS